jgi:hypothetical protein
MGRAFIETGPWILGRSYVTDRVDPLIEETLGDHKAPADPADGQVAFASQSVQRLRARDTAAMDGGLGHREKLAHRINLACSHSTLTMASWPVEKVAAVMAHCPTRPPHLALLCCPLDGDGPISALRSSLAFVWRTSGHHPVDGVPPLSPKMMCRYPGEVGDLTEGHAEHPGRVEDCGVGHVQAIPGRIGEGSGQ